jgi:hypothetical protein
VIAKLYQRCFCVPGCMYVRVCESVIVHTYTCTHDMYIHAYIRTYMHMYAYIHTHTHKTHTHTHTHTHTIYLMMENQIR